MTRRFRPPRRRALALFALAAPALAFLAGCTAFAPRGQQIWRSLTNHAYPDAPVGSPAFEAALDAYSESRAVGGNAACLLQNGDEVYPVMLDLIASARTRISLETYIVDRDATTDAFFQALEAAAARGVEVRVVADAAGFRRGVLADLRELVDSGVQARVFNPYFMSWTIFRGNNRSHRKILVVDGRHVVIGGLNISDAQTGDGVSGWRDTALYAAGPVAAEAEKVFAETWKQAGRGIVGKSLPLSLLNPVKKVVEAPVVDFYDNILGCPEFEPPPYNDAPSAAAPRAYDAPSARMRVVASSPDARNSTTYDLAILGLLGARERVDIASAYFVPHLGLRRALLAAAERGVTVRLLVPEKTDVKFVQEIGEGFYGELLRAGVRIYEWPYAILHAKTMAVDGRWLAVGSANMDGRSYFLNYEAVLAATDAILAEKAHAQFEADLRHAREVTLEEWERRDGGTKFLEAVMTPLAGQY